MKISRLTDILKKATAQGGHQMKDFLAQWSGDEGFKKTIPKKRFITLGKHFHHADPVIEDQAWPHYVTMYFWFYCFLCPYAVVFFLSLPRVFA